MLLSLLACGVPDFSIDGNVDGHAFPSVGTAFYGGPYIVFAAQEVDCMDVAFVDRNYREGEAPTELDVTLLQITYLDGGDVSDGFYSVEGEAAISTKLLHTADGVFTQYRADAGTIEVDPFDYEDVLGGTFDFTFDEGSLKSTWFAEWCLNLEE